MINQSIKKVLAGEIPDFVELREVYDEIFSGCADEIQTTSFLTAISSLSLNDDNVLALLASARDSLRFDGACVDIDNSIENILLDFKPNVFNVLLAQDLICSANDLCVSRYMFNSSSSFNRQFETLSELGVDIKKNPDINSCEFEKLNFAYLDLSLNNPYYKYAETIRAKLPFDNIFDISSRFLNPLNIKNLFLGVNDKKLVEFWANVALKLNNNNSVMVCGEDNLPFVTLHGKTSVCEAWKNKIFSYQITPDLFDIKEVALTEISIESSQESSILLEIMNGKLKNSIYDLILLNCAFSLYISKKTASIMDGFSLAKKTIDSGLMYEKFMQIKEFYVKQN